ncbi:MAG: 16S rRNA (guanine(527)-N(7))-methyltransferase RsmG [Tannerellaceae bacterium]|jgi:16S rRNA (guanine527-N7)-methyltransferase|nr:16S rRNA (guanine(527)-N(7))-methyltransferase RsmG [Tannerellaceae bacterium]
MDLILALFPELDEGQRNRMAALAGLYAEWNERINVVSRKDIEHLYLHHVLHSLGIAKLLRFRPETKVMDVGTGGGFPGIPLAILFPETHFHLIDGTGKKIVVCRAIVESLGMTNVTCDHRRAEEEKGTFDFVVSRATLALPPLAAMVQKNIHPEQRNALPNGLICLKGGDVSAEIRPFRHKAMVTDLSDCFPHPWFEKKKVLYLPLAGNKGWAKQRYPANA